MMFNGEDYCDNITVIIFIRTFRGLIYTYLQYDYGKHTENS